MADVEKNEVVAVATPAASGVPMWQQEKQGAKCCGCCCDYRRAVIVLAIINIVLGIAGIIGAIATTALINALPFDDDTVIEDIEDGNRLNLIFTAIGIVASICSLLGAMKYNVPLVAVNVVWLILSFIGTTIITVMAYKNADERYQEINPDDNTTIQTPYPSFIIGAVLTALFVYPHVGFIAEVRNGIMSAETYPREEFSCCCTTERRAT